MNLSQFVGIPLALAGAIVLAFGAQYQSRGLNKVETLAGGSFRRGLSLAHLLGLLKRPSWVFGTLLLGLAVALQIFSLVFSPLIIVQPIGVVGLIVTSLLNSKLSGVQLNRQVKTAIATAVTAIVIFVGVAALTAADQHLTALQLRITLIVFAIVLTAALTLFITLRKRAGPLFFIVSAGIIYGFVATFAKIVVRSVQQGEFDTLGWLCIAALVAGTILGMLFVQTAYSSGPPDLVVAGLTIIDPIVAVLIGVVVLGEAAGAPLWAVPLFIGSGALAVFGVFRLARFHPQTN